MAGDDGARPGTVTATPDRPPPRDRYDVVVVGGGVLGAAVAERLRASAPDRSVLLVEASGLPNEDGASVASPGLVPPLPTGGVRRTGGASSAAPGDRRDASDPSDRAALAWARAWLADVLAGRDADAATLGAGWLALASGAVPAGGALDGERPLRALLPAETTEAVCAMTGVPPEHPARLTTGGYVSVEGLTLALARRAVRAGADLAINARARPLGPTRLTLERLAADRRMRVSVHARHTVTADAVVVACGADGAALAEEALDGPVALPAAYLQFPRVRLGGTHGRGGGAAALPVATLAGWAWRPAPGGALLVPPPLPPDPDGYQPRGGRLVGVSVGLRRELVDRLLATPALAPLVASGRLELGKSARTVRGARFAVPPDGGAVARRVSDGWWLLAGGAWGLPNDLAAAAAVAAAVAGVGTPWREAGRTGLGGDLRRG